MDGTRFAAKDLKRFANRAPFLAHGAKSPAIHPRTDLPVWVFQLKTFDWLGLRPAPLYLEPIGPSPVRVDNHFAAGRTTGRVPIRMVDIWPPGRFAHRAKGAAH